MAISFALEYIIYFSAINILLQFIPKLKLKVRFTGGPLVCKRRSNSGNFGSNSRIRRYQKTHLERN